MWSHTQEQGLDIALPGTTSYVLRVTEWDWKLWSPLSALDRVPRDDNNNDGDDDNIDDGVDNDKGTLPLHMLTRHRTKSLI